MCWGGGGCIYTDGGGEREIEADKQIDSQIAIQTANRIV